MLIKVLDKKERQVTSAKSVSEIMTDILHLENEIDQDKEHFWVMGLDVVHRIKYIELVTLGILDSSLIHPRETLEWQ